MTSPTFSATASGKNPGDLLDTADISKSTLRRWERKGWISDRSASGRLSYVVLTIAGYRAS